MNKSESIAALSAALSIAQGQMRGAVKDSANPFFKSRYADLASVIEAAREPLAKNGLAVIQLINETGGVETVLTHSSGEWISSTIQLTPKTNSPQDAGSSITYARRYSYAAIVGLAQVDDDAETAMGRTSNTISANEQSVIERLLTETKANRASFLKYLGVQSVAQIPTNKYEDSVRALTRKYKDAEVQK
jgi:hypothetical protein